LAILQEHVELLGSAAMAMSAKVANVVLAKRDLEGALTGLKNIDIALERATLEENELLEQQRQGWQARRDKAREASAPATIRSLRDDAASLARRVRAIETSIDGLYSGAVSAGLLEHFKPFELVSVSAVYLRLLRTTRRRPWLSRVAERVAFRMTRMRVLAGVHLTHHKRDGVELASDG